MAIDTNTSHASGKRTVLVVEDNELNREMLSALLEEDFNVLQAENGLVGLEQLSKHYNDLSLVLLDLFMPECDGFEFLKQKSADERYDSVPVVVATASGSLEDEIKCLELGANDFVVKPYNFEVMLNRINNMVHLTEAASIVNQLTWDGLTGLYSKDFFYRNVEDVFAASPDEDYDMVCCDFENFKALNGHYGHESCDLLLSGLTARLRDTLPGFVMGGRIGGDVFAFLIDHQEAGWADMLYDITDGLNIPKPRLKFGIVERVNHEMSAVRICDRAITALEEVKGLPGVGIAYFDEEMRQRQHTEHILLESMEGAIEDRQFTVHFQPKHDLATDTTGGAEALVRWIHPELGFINPGLFITLFERNGLITKLDMYVWEEACKQIKRCKDEGLPVVPISVNASRLDFDVPDLADQLASMADEYGVERSLLHVELTETAYSDSPQLVTEALKKLREHGFLIELDDFGSGYSSLVSLNALPLDVMKLDMSMIRQATALNDFRIIQSTVKLAQILGLKTVVEGVEDAAEVEKLKGMGCDYIQGYYFSRPLKREEFEEYLAQQHGA